MKSKIKNPFVTSSLPKYLVLTLGLATLGFDQSSHAANLNWDGGDAIFNGTFGGTGSWDTSTLNWSNATADQAWTDTTGAADIATFGGTAGTVTLGTTVGAKGLVFTTSGYTITGSTLTIGTSGIDASSLASGTNTISSNLTISGGQTWNLGTGSTLTLSPTTFTRNAGATVVLDKSTNTGTLTFSPTLTNTIVPWALVKSSGTAANNSANGYTFATVSGGNIVAYTGATALTTAGTAPASSATTNYDWSSTGTATIGTSRSWNTIRYTGTGVIFNTNSTQTETINGFMNAGTGAVTMGGGQTMNIQSGSGELVLAAMTSGITINGPIINNGSTAGAVTIVGGSGQTVTLGGSNTFTGNLTVNSGTLAAGLGLGDPGTATSQGSALGNIGTAVARTITVNNGGILSLTTGNTLGTGNSANTLSAITLVVNAGGVFTTGLNTTSAGWWNKIGAVTLNGGTIHVGSGANTTNFQGLALIGNVTVAGNVASTIDNITGSSSTSNGIHLGQNATTGQIITFNVADVTGDANPDLTISAKLMDTSSGLVASGLTKSGLGTMLLTGANTFSGVVSVNSGGTLSVSSINSVNGGTPLLASSSLGAPTTVANGTIHLTGSGGNGTLLYTGSGETTDRVIDLAAGANAGLSGILDQSGTGLLKFTSAFTAAGGQTHTLVLRGSTAGTGAIAGAIVDNSGTNKTSLSKDGTGTWTITGANTYTGTTTVNNGTLQIGDGTNGTIGTTSAITVNTGGTLGLNLPTATSFNGSVTNSGTVAVSSNSATTFTSGISGGGALTKSGTGTLTLGNASTLGTTSLNAGALMLNGYTTTGAFTMANGTTLGTQMTLTGTSALTPASLTFGTSSTSNLAVDFNNLSPTVPVIDVSSSTLTLNGNVALTLANTSGLTNGIYTLVKYNTLSGAGVFTQSTTQITPRTTATVSNDAGNTSIILTVAADKPVWTGIVSGDWTTAVIPPNGSGDKNWKLLNASSVTDYISGDDTLFDDSATGTTNVNLAENVSPSSVTFNNNTNTYTISSTGGFGIQGSGPLILTGTGTVILTTTNSYSGSTTLGFGSILQLGNGTTDGSIAGTSGVTDNGILAYNWVGNHTSGYSISGAGSVTKSGAGTLSLNGANSYTGGTTLNTGTLSLGSTTALGGTASALTINGGALDTSVANLTLANTYPQNWNGDFSFVGTNNLNLGVGFVTLGANRQLTVTANNLTVGGQIDDGANGFGITKLGTGTLTLGGPNSYTGTTVINAGTLSIGTNANLGSTTVGQAPVTLDGGTLTTTAGITNTHAFTIGAGGGTINVPTTGQYFFNTANTLLGGGALTLTGNGTLVANIGNLRVAQTNTYSGNVILQGGGIFEYGVAGAVDAAATFTVNNQGEVAGQTGVTLPNDITVAGGTNSVLSFENGTTGIFSGAITLNANLAVGLRDWYNYSVVRGGTISGNISGIGSVTVNSGTGAGGTLTLSGNNSYVGATTVNASTISVASVGMTGANSNLGSNGTINLGSGATTSAVGLTYTGTGETSDKVLNLATTTGGLTLTQSGTGLLQFTTNPTITGSGAKTLTLTGSTAGSGEIAGIIPDSASGATSVTKTGTGIWTISGNNTYTGPITVTSTGTLIVSGTNNPSSVTIGINASGTRTGVVVAAATQALGTGAVTIGPGGNDATAILKLSGGISLNNPIILLGRTAATIGIENLSGSNTLSGTLTTDVGGSNYVIQSDAGSLTFTGATVGTINTGKSVTLQGAGNGAVGGVFSGAGGVTKSGTGTWTLGGTNTYTGATTVNGGTLAVTGSLAAASAVTVGGATATGSPTLTGTGTVNGSVTIAATGGGAAGTVNPGGVGTIGNLATGSATIAGTFACDVSGATADKLVVTGNLDISAATLTVTGTPTASSYVIATYTGTETGSTFASVPSGYTVTVDTTNKQVLLAPSAGYTSWATSKGLTTGVNDGTTQDPNHNGITNLMEYMLNGDPLNGESPASILPTQNVSGTNLVFDFHRLHSSASDTTQAFEYGSDLSGWTDVAITAGTFGGVTVAVTSDFPTAGVDHVVVTVPMGANTKLFGRLHVTKP